MNRQLKVGSKVPCCECDGDGYVRVSFVLKDKTIVPPRAVLCHACNGTGEEEIQARPGPEDTAETVLQ